jgi:iron complex transport system substrate-binding protein
MCSPRVVSLIASATEIVCALGCRGNLVGRSHECDYPLSVSKLPVCTKPKFNVRGSSLQIDQRVKAILQSALSVYDVYPEKLRDLQPEVIITQSHCEVCAVSLREVEEVVCEWLDSRPKTVSLEPNCLSDVWNDFGRVAEALLVPGAGEKLVKRLQQRMASISARVQQLRGRPRVACIEWIDPLMAAGNWLPELVEMAGGTSLFGTAGKHAPWLTWDQLTEKNPDVIIIFPCGFDLERTREEMLALTQRPEWPRLKAVRDRRVFLADGHQYFNRPGPRLVESLEILAEIFHPEYFHFGHEKSGWMSL